MRKLLFILCMLLSITTVAQDLSKDIEKMQREIAKQRAALDSSQKVRDSLLLQGVKKNDSAEMARYMEQNTRNLDSFVKNMKEREQKQKLSNWMRIGAGLLFLAIGIYGVMRKRKPKTGEPGS
jgi:septal ring factor EnvC (AmiA/AmiB activator)